MSICLTALYHPPADVEAFDKHYDEVHAVLAAKLPNLESFTVVRPGQGPDGSAPQYHLVATLVFPSAEDMTTALGSPEGQAAQEDMANFAAAGVTMLVGPLSRIV